MRNGKGNECLNKNQNRSVPYVTARPETTNHRRFQWTLKFNCN